MAKNKPLGFRIYIGDQPIEKLSEKERKEFADKAADRMGQAFKDYYNAHPDEYLKLLSTRGDTYANQPL